MFSLHHLNFLPRHMEAGGKYIMCRGEVIQQAVPKEASA